jgi:uncharacterized membrane protein
MQTITKVFEHYDHAKQAVTDLEAAGFSSSDISLVANKKYTKDETVADEATEAGAGAGIGAAAGGAVGLLTGLGLMAIPGVGPVVAAGWLASTALGAVAGGATGGIVGSLIGAGVPDEHAQVYSEALRRGGSLLSVKAEDNQVEQVHDILDRLQPLDPVGLGAEYRRTGWDKFDPDADTYVSDQSDTDRFRRVS